MRLSYSQVIKVADWWRGLGGAPHVEIAALEPLLWRDGSLRVSHVVEKLKLSGFRVSMTSNGALLHRQARALKSAGLDLLRVSWHSMSPETFRHITGGGNLQRVLQGIHSAIDAGLDLAINRVLLRGSTADLNDQVIFINEHRLRLKLLDLYWTAASAASYTKYYVAPNEVLAPLVESGYLSACEDAPLAHDGRARKKYRTPSGGVVEYKFTSGTRKAQEHCDDCRHRGDCLEDYGEYLRVFPDSTASLCYLRPDLAEYLSCDKAILCLPTTGLLHKDLVLSGRAKRIPLRLVLEGRCNFNCGFPNSAASWCLKQGRGFSFPRRDKVLEIEDQ